MPSPFAGGPGRTTAAAEPAEVARRRLRCTLVLNGRTSTSCPTRRPARTLVGTRLPNVVVLRSPSTFSGIAATRVAVAWCRNPARLR
jgi:hypothetical protein